jgi:predicted MFS family arabinose efflux permease
MLVWTAVAASHALVPGIATLVVLRIALGLSEAPSFPGVAQSIQRVLPPSQRSAGFGVMFTGSSIGAAIAAPLAIALEHKWGWRTAFLGTAAIGLAWLPLWVSVTRGERVRVALDAPADDERAPPLSLAELVALFRTPAVLRAAIVVIGTAPVIAFALLWFSLFLADVHHIKQDDQAVYLWIPPVAFDLGSIAFGVIASRVERGAANPHAPHRRLFAMAAALSLLIAAVPHMRTPLAAVLIGGVAAIGGGGVFALITGDMLSRVSSTRVSAAGGVTAAAQSLAYIIANPLIGAAVQKTHQYALACAGLAVWTVVPSVGWLLWRPPPRRGV